jgi:hypothetical protein
MSLVAQALLGLVLAVDAPDVAEEPEGGAGIAPIELIPRLELRQAYSRLGPALAAHDTVLELDIQFVQRLLLRYQQPYRVLRGAEGQLSGAGDIELQGVGILTSTPTRFVGVIVGAVLDTATQPLLGAGKEQLLFGGGAVVKPLRFWIAYGVLLERLSVGGSAARADVNQLGAQLGSILFGRQYNWLRLELDPIFDFEGDRARMFGTFEVGSLLIGRVGLFLRAGTQLFGERQLDYSLAAGVRYLFRLEQTRAKPPQS